MNPFKQLISDGDGAPSTMRVLSLAVVVPVMIVWTVLSIRQNTFIIPDTRIVMLVGSAFAGKSVQSLFENFTGINLSLPPSPQTSERSPTAATTSNPKSQ